MSWKPILVLAAGLLVLVGSAPAGGAPNRFNTYITCGHPRHHDRVCVSGDAPRAVIIAFRHANVRGHAIAASMTIEALGRYLKRGE